MFMLDHILQICAKEALLANQSYFSVLGYKGSLTRWKEGGGGR